MGEYISKTVGQIRVNVDCYCQDQDIWDVNIFVESDSWDEIYTATMQANSTQDLDNTIERLKCMALLHLLKRDRALDLLSKLFNVEIEMG